MSQQKSVTLYGMALALEGSYAGGGTITTPDDGLRLAEEAVLSVDYAHAGERSPPPGAGGGQTRAQPSGRTFSVQPSLEFAGPGAAYSASVFSNLHLLARLCGHDSSLDSNAGTENYTYTPTALDGSPASGHAEFYSRGEKRVATGIYGTLNFSVEAGGFLMLSPELQGLVELPSETALPALAGGYLSTEPPKAESMAFTWGNYTSGVVREVSFSQNRNLGPRADINSSGAHAGFAQGRRDPSAQVEVLLEAESFEATTPFHGASTLDPFAAFDAAIEAALSFEIGAGGTGNYNKLAFTASQAQLAQEPQPEADGDVAMWRLTFQLNTSDADTDDDYSIVTS